MTTTSPVANTARVKVGDSSTSDRPRRRRRSATRPLQYAALALYVVFLGFPLLFLVSAALKTPQELQSQSAGLLPTTLTVENFVAAFAKVNLLGALANSLFIALVSTTIVVLISVPAAYVLARSRSRLRAVSIGWILLSQMFPFILIVIPLFLLMARVGLVDSRVGLVLVYAVWCLPFALWMLQGHMTGIPVELEEAGAMDGASRLRVLGLIILPLLGPGLVATGLFSFVTAYSDFFFALVMIRDPSRQTLPLALARFVGAEGLVQLGPLAAASLLATIPSLMFFAFAQRHLASGLLAGAVKG